MPTRLRHVVLIYDARSAYDVKVMTGVASYVQETTEWNVYIEESALRDQRLPYLRSWRGDGIIADFDDPQIAAAVVRSNLPAVGFGSGYGWFERNSTIPYFLTNNEAIAELAASHFLHRGLRNFAYCGYPRSTTNGWSEERERAFVSHVTSRGFACTVYHGHHQTGRQWASLQRSLGEWLVQIPKPFGLMAANDARGRQVLEACRGCGLRVPEDTSVIGVDNDELLCKLSNPLLSSVEQGAKRLGYKAARILDRVMHGRKCETRYVIDPVEVVTRKSSETLAIADAIVVEAMAFISNHCSEGIKVDDVVDAIGISRSGLENRFRNILGYSAHTAIRRLQLHRTKQLILDSNLPLKRIASEAGFRSVQHMTTLFGRAFGQSPAKYRQSVATHLD
jgi:LacI family transcriptional regulator